MNPMPFPRRPAPKMVRIRQKRLDRERLADPRRELFEKLMAGRSDATFSFDDLCTLLTKLGYAMRKAKGSHIIFQRGSSFLNLQPSAGAKAKAYQVRQTREELQKMNLKP